MSVLQAEHASFQGSLWGGVEPQVTGPVHGARWLDASSWVIDHPGWLAGGDALFDELHRTIAWRNEERPMYDRVVAVPRLMASVVLDDQVPHHIRAIASSLAHDLGVTFGRMGLNLYRDGDDSVAWHSDRLPRTQLDNTVVALVSLGGVRTLRVRPKTASPTARPFEVVMRSGDLFVMGGASQRRWEHCVPKTRNAEPRISLALRSKGPETLPAGVREPNLGGCHH